MVKRLGDPTIVLNKALIVWWGNMDHCLVPWHFPVYIEPSASLLLSTITTYRNTFFPFFLLTAFLLIDYD